MILYQSEVLMLDRVTWRVQNFSGWSSAYDLHKTPSSVSQLSAIKYSLRFVLLLGLSNFAHAICDDSRAPNPAFVDTISFGPDQFSNVGVYIHARHGFWMFLLRLCVLTTSASIAPCGNAWSIHMSIHMSMSVGDAASSCMPPLITAKTWSTISFKMQCPGWYVTMHDPQIWQSTAPSMPSHCTDWYPQSAYEAGKLWYCAVCECWINSWVHDANARSGHLWH